MKTKNKTSNSGSFTINPMGKPRMTRSDAWKQRKCVMEYWSFKDELIKQAQNQGFELGDSFLVTFYIKMPKSWSKKKQLKKNLTAHDAKPDLDNLLKSINDCLKPKDDSKVYSISARKFWGERGHIVITNAI